MTVASEAKAAVVTALVSNESAPTAWTNIDGSSSKQDEVSRAADDIHSGETSSPGVEVTGSNGHANQILGESIVNVNTDAEAARSSYVGIESYPALTTQPAAVSSSAQSRPTSQQLSQIANPDAQGDSAVGSDRLVRGLFTQQEQIYRALYGWGSYSAKQTQSTNQ